MTSIGFPPRISCKFLGQHNPVNSYLAMSLFFKSVALFSVSDPDISAFL